MQILQVDEHFNSVGHLSIVTHKNIIQQILMKLLYPQHYLVNFPLQHDLLQSEHTGRHYFWGSGETIRQEQVWQRPPLDHKNAG